MQGRISGKFEELAARGEAALIPYVMAGYPRKSATVPVIRGLVRGGADIIELGFPFSDPLADGPVIQEAGTVSLARGTGMDWFLKTARGIRRRTDVPLVVMTYANIAHRRGYSRFVADAANAGIDGIILPDMSVEEARRGGYLEAARDGGMDTIFLASPNTSSGRMRAIAKESSGFLYMVPVYGTTGARTGVEDYAIRAVRGAKRAAAGAGIPVGVGFGVSAPRDVRMYVDAGADAVIVGSALLKAIGGAARGREEEAAASFAARLKRETAKKRGGGGGARRVRK